MLEKYQKLMENYDRAEKDFVEELSDFSKNVEEVKKSVDKINADLKSVNIVISDIDKQFEEKTGICNKKDMKFLWGAVALQCGRWMMLPTIDEETLTPTINDRKSAVKEGKKDKTLSGKELDKEREAKKGTRYIDVDQIMHMPVPFDAMLGTEDIVIKGVTQKGKNLYGGNHHSATVGHDPILGHLVGTANIITRSITFKDMYATTRMVEISSGRQQYVIKEPYGLINMCRDVRGSLCEEEERLVAAHMKEILHLQSDKYTKDGLPIPLIPASLQQKLLKRKWNSKELQEVLESGFEGVARNYFVAALINSSVGILHGFCYNENKDEKINLYAARTRKIVATSNVIAEALNLAAVIGVGAIGIVTENSALVKKAISHMDFGGYMSAIHQIASSEKLQENIRREFLQKELCNRFINEKYSFLEEAHYEEE